VFTDYAFSTSTSDSFSHPMLIPKDVLINSETPVALINRFKSKPSIIDFNAFSE